jgi:hypothetical protein
MKRGKKKRDGKLSMSDEISVYIPLLDFEPEV